MLLKFIKKLALFIFPLGLLLFSGLWLPPTPHASKSFLFASSLKDSLLQNTPTPRIIFIGGSNIGYSLNSQLIKDSLKLNPINTGITSRLGLKYMFDNTYNYIKKGDIVVLSLEYLLFHQKYDIVSDELLRVLVDVNASKLKLISNKQLVNFIGLIPKFSLTKFKPLEYFGYKENLIYNKNSFNKYGDAIAHWNSENIPTYVGPIHNNYNPKVIQQIKEFEDKLEKKEAILFFTFPALQDISYDKSKNKITHINEELKKSKIKTIGHLERYVLPDSIFFDSHYHLTKQGADIRTQLFISDLKKVLLHQL